MYVDVCFRSGGLYFHAVTCVLSQPGERGGKLDSMSEIAAFGAKVNLEGDKSIHFVGSLGVAELNFKTFILRECLVASGDLFEYLDGVKCFKKSIVGILWNLHSVHCCSSSLLLFFFISL